MLSIAFVLTLTLGLGLGQRHHPVAGCNPGPGYAGVDDTSVAAAAAYYPSATPAAAVDANERGGGTRGNHRFRGGSSSAPKAPASPETASPETASPETASPEQVSPETDTTTPAINYDPNANNSNGSDAITAPTGKTTPSKPGKVWQPEVGQSWQIILNRPLAVPADDSTPMTPDVDVYDIDLYENDATTISALRRRGKGCICYFSAGSYEPWRDDASDFAPSDLGKALDGWPDERWIDVTSPSVRAVMTKRIAEAAEKGCHAIDPDNVDGFQNDNGLGITEKQAADYIRFLSDEAGKHGLAIGLKNALDLVGDVMQYVDFAVNEQCSEYDECKKFAVFTASGKPVFHVEYPNRRAGGAVADRDRKVCCDSAENGDRFSTVIKDMDLGEWAQYCNGQVYETSTY